MYKNLAETKSFVEGFRKEKLPLDRDYVVFAQGPLLPLIAESRKAPLEFGPQSIYWEEKGAFTGELSPALAKELGCSYALAGHSERRQFFGETNETAAKRAIAAHKFGLNMVFCIGESLEERDSGRTFKVLEEQCAALFRGQPEALPGFAVAYEPVWAIGTGRTATSGQAQDAHQYIRELFSKNWGAKAAKELRILYGGSVKPENAKELMAQEDVDGVLVGGASLELSSFLKIAQAAG